MEPSDPTKHSAVYIRQVFQNEATDQSTYSLEVGAPLISKLFEIPTGVHWDLDMYISPEEGGAFFHNPVDAAQKYPDSDLRRYGYWSQPLQIFPNDGQVITYSLPLIDSNGKPYGVLGIELSLDFFSRYYLPSIDLPYDNSFYAISPMEQDRLLLDWYIPSGPLAKIYLYQGEALTLRPHTETYGLPTVQLPSLGEAYCVSHNLNIYSDNSPFIDQNWNLTGFVPTTSLKGNTDVARNTLTGVLIFTALFALAAAYMVVSFFMRKISGLTAHVATLSPHEQIRFHKTGVEELDTLTDSIEKLSANVINATKATARILQMTLLPIGGFEKEKGSDSVFITDYTQELMGAEGRERISDAEWQAAYASFTHYPAPQYQNTFFYKPKNSKDGMWLRILETQTEDRLLGVVLNVTKEIEEHHRLAKELDFDPMTRLLNRNAFRRDVSAKIEKDPDKIGLLIFSDLDSLKYINDTFGHEAGDNLIIQASKVFLSFQEEGGIASRISGDEFVVYLHGFSSKEEAQAIAEKHLIDNPHAVLTLPDGNRHRIRFSTGLSWYPEDANNVQTLLKFADYAMYEAKHKHKGAIFTFNRKSYDENIFLLENKEDLNRLFDEELLRFAFQPIVNLRDGSVFAYECLMRPQIETLRSPLSVLKLAASQSKLAQLEKLILFKYFETLAEKVDELDGALLFVNSIPSQILSNADFLYIHTHYQHLYPYAMVEITEEESNSPEQLDAKINNFRQAGLKIALDDFGNGHSNELRIISINPSLVKIDMGLIRGIAKDADRQHLIANLVTFCHSKGVPLIAEGAEDKEDLAQLIKLRVDYVQCFYTGRPDFAFTKPSAQIVEEILSLNKKKNMR